MTKQINILLVDDEPGIRNKLSLWLGQRGYSIHTSINGEDALNKLNSSLDIQILISDLNMPTMNGMELIKMCRSLKPNVGIIVITGYGDIETYIETMNMGAFEYLIKPFSFEDLDIAIQKLISTQKGE